MVQGQALWHKVANLAELTGQRPDRTDGPADWEPGSLATQRAVDTAKASNPLVVLHKAPETSYSILVVSWLLRMC